MIKKLTNNPLTRSGKSEMSPFISLHNDINSLFDDMFFNNFSLKHPFNSSFLEPKMDVLENDKGYEISVDVPGIKEEDIDLSIQEGVLTIKGKGVTKKEEKDCNYYICERSSGAFQRSIALSNDIITNKTEAVYKDGVLNIKIPKEKNPKSNAHKIKITSK